MRRLIIAALAALCGGAALADEARSGTIPASFPAPAAATAPDDAPAVTPAVAEPLSPLPFSGPVAAEPDAQRRALPGTPAALPPVTAQLFQIKGRVELWPMVAVSLGDAFYRMLAVGARGEFHLSERWSIGGHGLFGTTFAAAPVLVCGNGPCGDPAKDQLRSSPGNLDVLLGAELSWAPLYGKLSLAGEKTIHFDAYISAGPELLRQKIAADAASPLETSWNLGARVSLGQRFFLSDRFAVRVAASELLYSARVRGKSELERQLSIEGGVAWLFGGGR